MRIHLIIIALLLSAISASSQNAHISIKVPGIGNGHVVYQKLDKYSLIDSVAIVDGEAGIEIATESEITFARVIFKNKKLPLILHKGEDVKVVFNLENVYKSQIEGSPVSAYLNKGMCMDRKALSKTIKKNPDYLANIFLVESLDYGKDYAVFKSVADRFRDLEIPAARNLCDRVYASQRIEQELQKPEYQPYKAIIFWASWNQSSVEFLGKYVAEHPRERILAISMDGDSELHAKTILPISLAKDAAVTFKCEFNYFDNEYARVFRVTELPMLIER
ncbi:MAG: DUF4369 domain-containing protein [Bacteroidales bacterium]|nr:DUF4369 domain-containing protein [Bacteroidales bacterium]